MAAAPKHGEHEGCYHGVVAPVAEVESFAPQRLGQRLVEDECWLAAEEVLLGGGEEVVEVVERAVELVGVGIPKDEPCQLRCRSYDSHQRSKACPELAEWA